VVPAIPAQVIVVRQMQTAFRPATAQIFGRTFADAKKVKDATHRSRACLAEVVRVGHAR